MKMSAIGLKKVDTGSLDCRSFGYLGFLPLKGDIAVLYGYIGSRV